MANTLWVLPLLFLAILFHCVTLAQPTVQNSVWKTEKSANFQETVRLEPSRMPPLQVQIQQSMDLLLLELEKRRVETESLRTELADLKQGLMDNRVILNQLWDGMDLLVKKLVKNADGACADRREQRRKGKGRRRNRKRGGSGEGGRRRTKGEKVSTDNPDVAAGGGADTLANGSSRTSKEIAYRDDEGSESYNVTNVKSELPTSSRGRGSVPEYLNPHLYPRHGDEDGVLIEDVDSYVDESTSMSEMSTEPTATSPDPINALYNGSIPKGKLVTFYL